MGFSGSTPPMISGSMAAMPRVAFKDRPTRSPAHRVWIRRQPCVISGCEARDIQCCHFRTGTDGSMGKKPGDNWTFPCCGAHHREQHQVGEGAFQIRHNLDLDLICRHYAGLSPYLRSSTCKPNP